MRFIEKLLGSKIDDEPLESQLKDVTAWSTVINAMFPVPVFEVS
jgi:hypothetical protein